MPAVIKFDGDGLMDFFKSEGVRQHLDGEARRIAAEADREIAAHVRGSMDNPNAVGLAKVLDRTCVGIVRTANPAAANVVAKHPEILSKYTTKK